MLSKTGSRPEPRRYLPAGSKPRVDSSRPVSPRPSSGFIAQATSQPTMVVGMGLRQPSLENLVRIRDPYAAIAVLEMNLQGDSLADCARKIGLSRARCQQMANQAARELRTLRFANDEEMPQHNPHSSIDRFNHRDFWLRQIAYAMGQQLTQAVRRRTNGSPRELAVATKVGEAFDLGPKETLRLIQQFEDELYRTDWKGADAVRRHRVIAGTLAPRYGMAAGALMSLLWKYEKTLFGPSDG